MLKQNTLKGSFSLCGKGLHTGLHLTVTFNPAQENYGYKYEHRAEHVYELGYEVSVIVERDLLERSVIVYKIVYMFAYVEYYYYNDNQQQGKEEGPYELSYDISVEYRYFKIVIHYNLVSRSFTVFSFQVKKSPASIWKRACLTSSR